MTAAQLSAPFAPANVSWRVGSTTSDKQKGLALAYIDARDVMARLDEVCTPAGWQDRYEFHGARTICYLSVKIDGEWVTKADGAGDSDVEAEKGAISDAFKRAAVKWGIGRYLYDVESPWVKLKAAGRSYAIEDSEYPRLHRILGATAKPARAVVAAKPLPATAPATTPFDEADVEDRIILETMIMAARAAVTVEELTGWYRLQRGEIEALPTHQRDEIMAELSSLKAGLTNILAAG